MSSTHGRSKPPPQDHRQRQATAFLTYNPDEFSASQEAYKLPNFRKNSVVNAEKATGKKAGSSGAQMGFIPKAESSAPKDARRDDKSQNPPRKDAKVAGKNIVTSPSRGRPSKRVEASASDSENNEELPDLPKRKSPARARKQGTTPKHYKKVSRSIPQSAPASEDEFLLVEPLKSDIPGMELMFSSQESVPSQSSSQAYKKRKLVATDEVKVTKGSAKSGHQVERDPSSSSESEADSLPPLQKKRKTAGDSQASSKPTSLLTSASSKATQATQATQAKKSTNLPNEPSDERPKPDVKGKGKAIEPLIVENPTATGATAQQKSTTKAQTLDTRKGSQLADNGRSELPRSSTLPPSKAQQGTGVKRKASRDSSKPSALQSGPLLARKDRRNDSMESDTSDSDCVPVASSIVKAPQAGSAKASKSNLARSASKTPVTRPLSPRKSDSANEKPTSVLSSSDATSSRPRPRARPKIPPHPPSDLKPLPISSAEIAKSFGVTPKASKSGNLQSKEQSSVASTSTEKTARKARPTEKALLADAEKAKKKPLKEGDANRRSAPPQAIEITSSPVKQQPKKQKAEARLTKAKKISITDDEEDSDDPADLPDADTLFSNAAAGVEDIFSSQSTGTFAGQDQIEDEENDSEGDFTMAYTQAPNVTTSLRCPFCDGALPDKPSEKLVTMLVKLCSREDIRIRKVPANDLALGLPMTVTIEACKRHREETETIPRGLEAGYPDKQSVDWERLKDRIVVISSQLTGIVFGPEESIFFDIAKKEWQAKGARKMGNVLNEFSSFQQEMPGYYGFKGFELIMAALKENFVDNGIITSTKTRPLDINTFLRRVLVPEAAVRLIQDDRKNCSTKEATVILEESRAYGAAVFGQDASLAGSESKREKRDREREQQAFRQEIESILSSQEAGSKALQRGRDAVVALHALLAKQA